jgi:YD repeat-containing protein
MKQTRTTRILIAVFGLCAGILADISWGSSVTYSYDLSHRLVAYETDAGSKIDYRYDAAGNIRHVHGVQDIDHDGLPDAWEHLFWPDLTCTSGNTDSDGDGMTDREEWCSRTDPTCADSCMHAVYCNQAGPSGITIQWSSATNLMYCIDRTKDLMPPIRFQVLQEGLPGTPPENCFTDPTVSTNDWKCFYRIRVENE